VQLWCPECSAAASHKGCSSKSIRDYLRRRGIRATIPERRDQRGNPARAGGRPPAFDPVIYQRRSVVERCFNRLKQFRAIATRYDKTARISDQPLL
jgi:transposase